MDSNELPPAWDDEWASAWASDPANAALSAARVVRIDKGGIQVSDRPGSATHVVAAKAVRRVVVGDVVGVDATAGRIETILPRRTVFERRSPGVQRDDLHLGTRALAANMDHVLVLQPLDLGVNAGRLCRELVLAWQSGARPVVVLTKADLVEPEVLEEQRAIAERNAPDVAVVTTSTRDRSGLESLRRVIDRPVEHPGTSERSDAPPVRVVALLGASGAGKSSLANSLAGRAVALTAEVRDHDRRGRHTTTAGQMLDLDGSTWLIDTPGIRGVGLWESDEGLELAFADLEPFAQDCRFDDCSHRHEPGCALIEAVANGRVPEERLELWRQLADEIDELEADLEVRDRAVDRAENQRARRRAASRDADPNGTESDGTESDGTESDGTGH